MNYHHLSPIITTFYSSPIVEKNSNLKKSRRHLINRSRWRGAGFWPDARRDAGRIPAAGCARGTTTHPAKRAAALVYFFPIWPVEVHNTKSLHAAAVICEMASNPATPPGPLNNPNVTIIGRPLRLWHRARERSRGRRQSRGRELTTGI